MSCIAIEGKPTLAHSAPTFSCLAPSRINVTEGNFLKKSKPSKRAVVFNTEYLSLRIFEAYLIK